MKQVKFDGLRWKLFTKDSLFNPNTEGVLAVVSDGDFNLGDTDDFDKEAELIMQGKSNIHPNDVT